MSGGFHGPAAPATVDFLDVHDPAWVRFVHGHPDATCFHQPAWCRTLVSAYGFSAFAAVQRNARGEVVAGLPVVEIRRPGGGRRWVSLPFSDDCPPLVADGGSVTGLMLGTDGVRRARRVTDLEVRADVGLSAAVASRQVAMTSEAALWTRSAEGEVPRRLRSSVRRHVAAARRAGVEVGAAATLSDVVDTYYRLHVRTRRRQGVPTQPRRYFRLLWENLVEPGGGFVLIARHRGVPVAGAVYLLGGRTVTYKYGASDPGAWSLRPNHLVMASAIERAVEGGYQRLDLGRTDSGNSGLLRFKESWGATSQPLRYTSFAGSVAYREGWPGRALVAPVIRRGPAIVCRGLGELLYRYAA